ncbi:TonB-dependent receptor [Spirosoma sp. BT702]|uniref:TonB-dependent receptor n=1 Tax=Spirosoma profusum TaxID=2771354 RepID=A0A926XZ20_9BACT|nr:TonB-dependent receptor [Spirosoma profusum]MBD2700488.1 TonB-dependent receptor [Spirosoma profusum]
MRVGFLQIMLITVLASMAYAGPVTAQELLNRKVSVQANEQEIKLVLRQLEKQADIRFMYSPQVIPSSRKVSLNVTNQPLAEVLAILLKPIHVVYEVTGKQILLDKAPSTGQIEPLAAPKITEDLTVRTIAGQVTDAENKQPIPGVTVIVKGTSKGTATDVSGHYSLRIDDADQTLVFSFVGYESQDVTIGNQSQVAVSLKPDVKALSEVVVVGYGTKKKTSVTAAVATLEGNQLVKSPIANVSNGLSGRIAGVTSKQSSGEPGKDGDDIKIRGIGTIGNSNPLVVVDGIQRSLSQLNSQEIETITVLKDAAAVAPYGLAGANGVILVTTKRGKEGAMSLTYNGWVGMQRPTQYPNYLDSYGYAKLLNEANKNVGVAPTYTDEQLQKFKDGSDPNHYPNTDWVREVLSFNAPITNHNLSLSGGSQKVRFFTSLGYMYQEGVVRNINMNRYNLAVNVDADATATTTVSLDIKGTLQKNTEPAGFNGTSIFTDVTKNAPILPLRYDNGLPGTNTLPMIYESGYNRTNSDILYSQITVRQQLPFIPGLALKGVAAYDRFNDFNKRWTLPITYYLLNAKDEFTPLKGGPATPTLSESYEQRQILTLQGYITYAHSFGKHTIDALGVLEKRTGNSLSFAASRLSYAVPMDELSLGSTDKTTFDNSGGSSSNAQTGLVYRVGYTYADKYLLELGGRYDGHYYFAPGKRFEFFPAVSVGWRLSEEPFLRNNANWIDNLKVRASYGKSGNLAGNPFQFLSSYGLNNSYVFGGTSPYQVQGVFERSEPNRNITWETAFKTDIGLEGSLWHGKLGFELDYFWENRSNMLLPPSASVPLEYGIGISQENAGIMKNHGVDINLTTAHRLGKDLRLNVGLNFSYAQNKLIQTFESPATYDNPNRRRTGRPWNTQFGYRAIGYFQSAEEVKSSPTQFGTLLPGDIKYEDVNGDGKIDLNDEVVIGNPSFPAIIFGLTPSISWKGFDVNMLWQGATKVSFYLGDDAAFPFFNGAKVQDIHLNYWTPENRDAPNPRLTPSPTTNNSQISSFWLRDASYVRLKTLEVGYTLPKTLLNKAKIGSVRIFASGQNLLTLAKIKNFDPEVSNLKGRYYFQQRVLTAGLNIGF